ncbi:MAG: hypothetical protein A2148_09015 [Chloroflexi bacterium RBG_16_68_14]|nr:MAG: hypothetical protein A2148_09015 [Chloroflexi bacterium RBG_16_68_14]
MTEASPTGIAPKPWGIPAVLLALALPLLLWGSSLGLAIAQGAPEELSDGEIVTGLIFTLVLDLVLIGLAAGLSLWRYRLPWAALGLRPFDRGLWWLPLVAAAVAHVSIIVYTAVLTSVGADAPEQDIEDLFESRMVLPLAGAVTVLVAPLAEEIFFRGFVFAGLLRPFGLGGAMVVSGLLFGAFHITGPDTVGLVVPFGAVGVLLAWLYYRTGSLWPSIGTHFIFNLVSFAVLASLAGNGS